MDFGAISVNFEELSAKQSGGPLLVGEIGVNHNGDEETLFKLMDGGIAAGIDVLKFQRFISKDEISMYAPSTNYQLENKQASKQLEMAESLELTDEQLWKAKRYCDERGVGFLCTAFEFDSVDFLVNNLGVKSIKVPSPEITNLPLLQYIANRFSEVILSTGASNLAEVARARDCFANHELVLLHCVSEYPAPTEELNLSVISNLSSVFNVPCGFSDHTNTNLAPIVAASLGAVLIEKHYTLDRSLPGPDHAASATIEEMKDLKNALSELSKMQGDGVKSIMPSEIKNRDLIRKSVTCAVEKLPKGTVINQSHLLIKRPVYENSVEPFDLHKVLGKVLKNDKEFDEPIYWGDF
jgi:sialic acid synthase SpsE